jgi:hypothetical protein
MFRSFRLYDLVFRSTQGLPLPARALTTLLLKSIIARLLRHDSIRVCSFVWMNNHVHMKLYSLDAEALSQFHQGLKKRISDFLKRLLGIERLRLWDDRTNIAEILDLDAAIDRFAYDFTNPIRARLCSSIDRFQGYNTWKEFLTASPAVDTVIETTVPWIHATDIPRLSANNPGGKEERSIIKQLHERARNRSETLKLYPFIWLKAFNITTPQQIEEVRKRIISRVRAYEQEFRNKKEPSHFIEGYDVTDSYRPARRERKIFCLSSETELRIAFLERFKRFVRQCRDCYQSAKQGVRNVDWPPECFLPRIPKLCNAT